MDMFNLAHFSSYELACADLPTIDVHYISDKLSTQGPNWPHLTTFVWSVYCVIIVLTIYNSGVQEKSP